MSREGPAGLDDWLSQRLGKPAARKPAEVEEQTFTHTVPVPVTKNAPADEVKKLVLGPDEEFINYIREQQTEAKVTYIEKNLLHKPEFVIRCSSQEKLNSCEELINDLIEGVRDDLDALSAQYPDAVPKGKQQWADEDDEDFDLPGPEAESSPSAVSDRRSYKGGSPKGDWSNNRYNKGKGGSSPYNNYNNGTPMSQRSTPYSKGDRGDGFRDNYRDRGEKGEKGDNFREKGEKGDRRMGGDKGKSKGKGKEESGDSPQRQRSQKGDRGFFNNEDGGKGGKDGGKEVDADGWQVAGGAVSGGSRRGWRWARRQFFWPPQ